MRFVLRYAIVGSGAVGGLYGAMLARGGHDVHFLMRSDYEHVKKHGLRIDSVSGDFVVSSPNIYSDVHDMPKCDVIIVAMKSTSNACLAEYLPELVADQAAVLTLQNGLDVEADCVRALSRDGRPIENVDVLGGCCFLCSNKVGPGHIEHLDYGRIVFGQFQHTGATLNVSSSKDRWGARIEAEMTGSGIDAHWTDNLAAARWRKLMWNIPFNGLSVALNCSTDAIIASPPARSLAERLIREVHHGAGVCGIQIEQSAIEKTMNHTETMVPYDSSMRLDFLAGRPMEIDAIFASPLRRVAQHASSRCASGDADPVEPMPAVSMLCQQLQFLDSRRPAASKKAP